MINPQSTIRTPHSDDGGGFTLPRRARTTTHRPAAINASTVFALVLTVIAALLVTMVVKYVVLDRRPPAPEAPATYKVTVAAINLLDKVQILTHHVKTINVTKKEYDDLMGNRARVVLRGNQPVGRTTLKPIKAEEPIYEDQLEPLQYAEAVSLRLSGDKVAFNLEVSVNQAAGGLIRMGDRVDVLCTLSNEALGAGGHATAVIARKVRVIGRFNETRTAAPPNPGNTRAYTLEVSPYRAALLELARSVGASFALNPIPQVVRGDGTTPVKGDASPIGLPAPDVDDPVTDRVTTEDLAALFGIKPPPEPPKPVIWEVERFHGTSKQDPFTFPGYSNGLAPADQPPVPPKGGRPDAAGPPRPGTGSGAFLKNPAAAGAGTRNPGLRPEGAGARLAAPRGSAGGPALMVAFHRNNDFGFRPAGSQVKPC
jgi:Flp pilus assembly protein CpaB